VILEKLILERLSREVEYLPGIDKLTRLRRLKVFGAPHLLQLLRVGGLVALEEGLSLPKKLYYTEVGAAELPNLHNLTNWSF
jgi:hypothetical protein